MTRNWKFFFMILVLPFVGSIPLGMIVSGLFDEPLNIAAAQQYHYLVGLIAGAWIWGEVAHVHPH